MKNLSRTDTEVIDLIRRFPGLTAKEIATKMGRASSTTSEKLHKLRESGDLKRLGMLWYVGDAHVLDDDRDKNDAPPERPSTLHLAERLVQVRDEMRRLTEEERAIVAELEER